MLKECLDIFDKEYAVKGEKLITDNYILSEGTYVLVKNGMITTVKDAPKQKDFDAIAFKDFIVKDYLSKLLDMNKPIDQKKVIHSNNYHAFWVKKESLKADKDGNRKLTEEIVKHYYEILKNPMTKYKNKGLDLYLSVEKNIGKPDVKQLELHKQWILENIFTLIENNDIKDDKNYLKIYFDVDENLYRIENERYVIPNIYNATEYNIIRDEQIFGLPNNNMGLNGKKPYLENKTRKNKLPYLISTNEVSLQKKFFDYLYNYANKGKTNIYISEKNKITALDHIEILDKPFEGYYLRIKKGKELEIHDFDIVTGFNPKIDPIVFRQVIPVPEKGATDFVYEKIDQLEMIKNIINSTFFKKFLSGNFFSDSKDIRLNDFRVKEELLNCRNGYFNWFFKGDQRIVKSFFSKSTLELIKNSISFGYVPKATEQYNVRDTLMGYFEGSTRMADRFKTIFNRLSDEINGKTTGVIQTDEEYYFIAGQLAKYLLSFNKASKQVYSIINPVINGKIDDNLRTIIKNLFIKYNYAIQPSKRFSNLYAMFFSYESEIKKINQETLIAGYLYSSLIYEKKVKEEEDNDVE
ncbi:MAG: CRISPR-associated protein Cse4 [Eubacterium sp.]